jgi:glycosyltransferase involved in cell wall biosynthesis
MVRAFRELGHEVEVSALIDKTGGGHWQTTAKGLKWLRDLSPNWLYEILALTYNLYGYWRLSHSIRTILPDLIYERYALNTVCGVLAARRFRIPLVLEVNAPLCYEQLKLGKLTFRTSARLLERWICSHADLTITVSEAMKRMLLQEGVPAEKLVVMRNGVDPSRLHPAVSGKSVRRRYGLEAKIVIGFVGWFRPWHGLEMLLEIMYEERLGAAGVRLLLVGDGPAYSVLYRFAEQHDLLPFVTFTGAVDRDGIPSHIAAMDIAVQPTAPEYACPMKIIEYMGIGKCIVAPDQPNIRELIDDKVTGFLFRKESKSELRKTLLGLLTDAEKREIVGQNAVRCVFERGLLWRTNAENTLALVFGTKIQQDEARPRAPRKVFGAADGRS